MKHIITLYYLYKLRRKHPDKRFVIQKARSGSYYICRYKPKKGIKDYVRISNHQRLNRHKNKIIPNMSSNWNYKKILWYYVGFRKGV